MTAVMFAPVVAWSGWAVVVLMIPVLLVVLRLEKRVEVRRMLAAAVLAVGLGVALLADTVVMPTCETCRLIDPDHCWSCWSIYWLNCLGC